MSVAYQELRWTPPVPPAGVARATDHLPRRKINRAYAISAFVLLDFLSIFISGCMSSILYLECLLSLDAIYAGFGLSVVSIALYSLTGAYQTRKLTSPKKFMISRWTVLFCVWSALLVVAFCVKQSEEFSRGVIFLWLALSLGIIAAAGAILPILYKNTNCLATLKKKYVHITTPNIPDPSSGPDALDKSWEMLRQIETLSADDAMNAIDVEAGAGNNIVISLLSAELPGLMKEIEKFRLTGVDIYLDIHIPTNSFSCRVSEFLHLPPVHIIRRPVGDAGLAIKRAVDIAISGVALVALTPLFLIIAVLIFLEDGRPIFFRQPRKGFRQQVFIVWKFRTMRTNETDVGAVRQAEKNDHRITMVGRFLRRTGLDELPQLCNVMQGSMSMVGPRPHALEMNVDGVLVGELFENYSARHNIRPGITGLAQVRGFRGPVHDLTHLKMRTESDLEYIERWSPILNVWIIFSTIAIVGREVFISKRG